MVDVEMRGEGEDYPATFYPDAEAHRTLGARALRSVEGIDRLKERAFPDAE